MRSACSSTRSSVLPDDGDPMLRANILAELAAQYMITGRIEEAISSATRALEEAPPDARRTRSIAANIRGGTLAHEGRIDEGLADFDAPVRRAGDDRDALLRYYVNMSDTLHLLGRFEESLDIAAQGFELAR